ncbi:cytochrome d ubiquinol oxidase subunit II [Pusillimonas sp. DMV24BSW_D]|uniref:cytochrome d ubiquinol oxidase subunit II n=1 Tax=Neopusillimonas aestuarii TaxID=2716226 RepID=UPI00140E578F|nr:cytochrome d ubiquinol oxidase subunit II [Pusillimonas sp. DMV24BSW_D]QIM48925.1 cytochrome d ubiquinol oxidase subunit II [Pusillimonas sp. DMV24BSW_D]
MIDSLVALLGLQAHDPHFWMPLAFMFLFFALVVAGTVLDGFDIGVGCLVPFASPVLRMRMLALLSPWRDANEFWLLLGLTLLATAFPLAWEVVMGQLYVPLTLLGLGVFMRSAAFELRLRSPIASQNGWALVFAVGSWMTALAHGYLLGQIVTGYESGAGYVSYAGFVALCAVAAYSLLGAAWLMMREPGELRVRAAYWGRQAVRWAAAGAVAVSLVLAFANTGVFLRWTSGSQWLVIVLLWVWILISFMIIEMMLQRTIHRSYRHAWLPFLLVLLVFLITLGGLGYSFFPYLVLDNVTIWDAAASVDALRLILAAAVIALPVALIFNIWVYWRMFGVSRPPQPPAFRQRAN